MNITKEKEGNRLTISISGRLDAKNAPKLEAELSGGVLDDVDELHFDMSELEYTSSMGLRVMLRAYQVIEDKDGKMVIEHVNDDLMEVFELTGFTDFLDIEN